MIKEESLSKENSYLNSKFFELLSNNTNSSVNNSSDITFDKIIKIDHFFDHVMIETRFSFVNSLWNGNNAYIKINDHYYWMDQHNWIEEDSYEEKKNICDNLDFFDDKWSTPIKIIYRKYNNNSQEKELKITFGYKFHPQNNLSNLEVNKCKVLSALSPRKEVISFAELNVSIK